MKTPMATALFLATSLAFFGLIAINGAEARILPAGSLGLIKVAIIAAYGKSYSPPPPSPIPSPRTKELTSNFEKHLSPPVSQSPKTDPSIGQVTTSNGRTLPSPPPPPKPASPKGQLEIGSDPCNNEYISMITNFGRPVPGKPPSPKPASPTGQITFDPDQPKVSISMIKFFEKPVPSKPPSPKPATPTRPVITFDPEPKVSISMITNLERPVPRKPPSPKPASPTRQITFDLEPKVHERSPPEQYVFST